MRDAALRLVPDFCLVQPDFHLYKTGTQEWPNWVLSLNPQLLAAGLAMLGLPGGSTEVCHVKGGRAGIALLCAIQHGSSCATHPGPAASLGCSAAARAAVPEMGLAVCFPLLELLGSGAKWLLPRCPGSSSICRDGLGTTGAFVQRGKRQSTQI